MENIKNSINTNSNPSDSKRQAVSSMSNPFGTNPFAAASSKVKQVKVANRSIPSTVETLIQLTPKERVRAIMRMPASTQQDDAFCNLAQNKYLDGKSRLAAAMKLKDSERRNTLLTELAKDQSLKGTIRLKAVDKISDFEKRKEMFTELAQDKSLSEIYRTEAELSLEFKIELEEAQILEEAIKNKNLDKGQKTKPVILIEAKLEPEEKIKELKIEEIEILLPVEAPLQKNEDVRIQINPADLERKEMAFLAIVQDKDLNKNQCQGYRLTAALKLAPSPRREDTLASLAQDKDSNCCFSIFRKTVVHIKNMQEYKDRIIDVRFDKNISVEAALALSPGQRREDILALLANNNQLQSHNYNLISSEVFENSRLKAALGLSPGQRREDILALLANELKSSNYDHKVYHNNVIVQENTALKAALNMTPGQRKEEILALLAQDKNLSANYRLEAANSMAGGEAEDENQQ